MNFNDRLAVHSGHANGAPREFLKLLVFVVTMALICIVAPGEPGRKIIAAVAFPLFAMMTLEASAAGFEVVQTLTSPFVLLERVAPYAASLLLIAFFSSTCLQWVRHRPGGHE